MKKNNIPRNEYIRKPVGKTNPYKQDVIYDPMGQWKYPGQVTKIPSNQITMQGVNYPVYGEDNLGYGQMMYPGANYTFPGQYVTEIPMAQKGGPSKDIKDLQTLPEFNVISAIPGSKYENTLKYLQNLEEYAGKGYYNLWNKHGAPGIDLVSNVKERANFNPFTNTMKVVDMATKYKNYPFYPELKYGLTDGTILIEPDNFISELAHAKQLKDAGLLNFAGRHVSDWFKSPYFTAYGLYNKPSQYETGALWGEGQYETPGTIEYEAHKQIEPALYKELIDNLDKQTNYKIDVVKKKKGGIPIAQKGYNVIPNIEFKQGVGSQYDPVLETIMIDEDDYKHADLDELLRHELWHHYQNYNNWLRLPEEFPTMQRPQTPATDEVLQNYYNRRKSDVEELTKGFKQRYPEFTFVPDQLIHDKEVENVQYTQPWTMEGEGRLAETWKGMEDLYRQGYNVDDFVKNFYIPLVNKITSEKKKYGGDPSLPDLTGHYQKGGSLTYDQWKKKYKLVESPDYNLKRAWELGYTPDAKGHLPTVDEETGVFLKTRNHPTLKKELDWYNSPAGEDFRNQNDIDSSGTYFKYIPKNPNLLKQGGWLDEYQKGGRSPIYLTDANDPRIRAYNDSLAAYNLSKKNEALFNKNPGDPLVAQYNKQGADLTKRTGIQPVSIKGSLGWTQPYRKEDLAQIEDAWIAKFKKPVQPYIYRKEEEEEKPKQDNIIYVDDKNDPRYKAYKDSLYVREKSDQTFLKKSKTRPLTKEEKDFWKDKKTGLVPNVVEYDPNYPGAGYFGHFKKPVQEVRIREQPKEKAEYMQSRPVSMPTMSPEEMTITGRIKTPSTFVKQKFDPVTRRYYPYLVEGWNTPAEQGQRIYNRDIPSGGFATPEGFVPQFKPTEDKPYNYWEIDNKKKVVKKKQNGGWLDNYQPGGVNMPSETTQSLVPAYMKYLPKTAKEAEEREKARKKGEEETRKLKEKFYKEEKEKLGASPIALGRAIALGVDPVEAKEKIEKQNKQFAKEAAEQRLEEELTPVDDQYILEKAIDYGSMLLGPEMFELSALAKQGAKKLASKLSSKPVESIFSSLKKKPIPDWLAEQIRFKNLPELNNPEASEVLENILTRIKTPEGKRRLKELGVLDPSILEDLKILNDENTLGSYWLERIALNPNLPEVKKVTRHEIEHAVQDARQLSLQNKYNWDRGNFKFLFRPKKAKAAWDEASRETTDIDELLKKLELRKTPEKINWSEVKRSSGKPDPSKLFEYMSDKQKATNYFDSGSGGREKSPFLAEVQQYMMDQGLIPKTSYVEVTPEMVKETFANALFDEKGGGKYLRLFNIMKPTEGNYKLISEGLNKMLGVIPPAAIIGTGAAMQEKKTGGWLDSYQDRGEVREEPKLIQGYRLPEVTITDEQPGFLDRLTRRLQNTDFVKQLTNRIAESTGGKDWYKDPSKGFGSALAEVAMLPFATPQLAATYGVTGKVQTPSEAMNIQNPYAAFAVDAVLDPTNLVGAGIADDALKLSSRAGKYLTTKTPLKNAYKINPFAFKPNPEAYYHRSPNLKNIVNQETGMLQGFGASEEGKLLSKTTGSGLGNGISLKKSPHSEMYYSKGTPLDGGRTNMILDEKTGKIIPGQFFKGPYMVEVADVPFVAKANGKFSKIFNPETGQSVRGELPPLGIGHYAVPKRPISLDEAKFYKEDWLRGYKQIDTPTQLPGSPNVQQAGFINLKGAFQKYPKGPLTKEEIEAYKNSDFYKQTTKQHEDALSKYGDKWTLPNYAEKNLQEAIETGNRSRINQELYGGRNWTPSDYAIAGMVGSIYPAGAGVYGLAFSPPAVKNKALKKMGVIDPRDYGTLTDKDTIIDITDRPMNFAKVNQTADGQIIIGGEFIENANNTVRKAKDWLTATDTYSDKEYPSKDIQSFYGIEDGKFKVGKANDFDPETEIVPRRFGAINIDKAVMNNKEMRLLDKEGNPIYQNTPNTGKFILYSPSTGKKQFTYINSGASGVKKVNDFLKKNKDAQYIHLDNGRYEYYGLNPEGLTESDFRQYYQQDLERKGNPGYNLIIKKTGGWLDNMD